MKIQTLSHSIMFPDDDTVWGITLDVMVLLASATTVLFDYCNIPGLIVAASDIANNTTVFLNRLESVVAVLGMIYTALRIVVLIKDKFIPWFKRDKPVAGFKSNKNKKDE